MNGVVSSQVGDFLYKKGIRNPCLFNFKRMAALSRPFFCWRDRSHRFQRWVTVKPKQQVLVKGSTAKTAAQNEGTEKKKKQLGGIVVESQSSL